MCSYPTAPPSAAAAARDAVHVSGQAELPHFHLPGKPVDHDVPQGQVAVHNLRGQVRDSASRRERMHKTLLRRHHFRSEVLHRQGDVVGGDGEEALQLGVCAQVGPVGLQEGPQSAVAHVLHDQDVRFCTQSDGGFARSQEDNKEHTGVFCLSPSLMFQSSNWRMFLWCKSFLMMETSISTCF